MLRELLDKQCEYTNHFFNALDLQEAEKVLSALLQCQGVIFFTGVGKSGLVAKKIAFTMVSTGTRAPYFNEVNPY